MRLAGRKLGDEVIADIAVGQQAVLERHFKDQLGFGKAVAKRKLPGVWIEVAAWAWPRKADGNAEILVHAGR